MNFHFISILYLIMFIYLFSLLSKLKFIYFDFLSIEVFLISYKFIDLHSLLYKLIVFFNEKNYCDIF